MAEVKWIKIVVDVFDDEKIRIIESMPSGDTLVCIWFKLLCLAGKCNDGGLLFISDRVPYTDEMLSIIFRKTQQTIRAAMDIFQRFEMIEVVDDAYAVVNWDKHQALGSLEKMREDAKRRNREYRERKKALAAGDAERDVTETSRETERNVTVTRQNKNKNKKENKKEESIRAPSAHERSVLNEFNELWKDYPAGRKQGKDKAYRAYAKARDAGATFEEVKEGLEGYKAYIDRERVETRYVKMAQTWFNGKCWADDYGAESDDKKGYGGAEEFYKAALKHGEMETNK